MVFFSYSAEFSNKDIVQDLNRLLKMSTSGNSGTLRMFTADTFACDYDNTLGRAMSISIPHQLQSAFLNVTLFSKEIRLLMQLKSKERVMQLSIRKNCGYWIAHLAKRNGVVLKAQASTL